MSKQLRVGFAMTVLLVGFVSGCTSLYPFCNRVEEVAWDKIPAAAQATITANIGGSEGTFTMETKDGQAIYTAFGKDKAGRDVEIQVAADGHLINIKSQNLHRWRLSCSYSAARLCLRRLVSHG